MAKTLTFKTLENEPVDREAALEHYFAQMQRANELMKQDQEEINRLKAETQAIGVQTRAVLEQLEAALYA